MMWLTLCLALQNPVMTVEPESVAIGQPLQVEFVHDHLSANGLAGPKPSLDLDDSWVVLEGPEVTTVPGQEGQRTSVRWSVLSLEPGERAVPGFDLVLADGTKLSVGGTKLTVAAELGVGEDAPRPLPPFQEVQERTGSLRPVHLGLLALGLISLLAWRIWLRRRGGEQTGGEELGEWARFVALKSHWADSKSDSGSGSDSGAVDIKEVSGQLASLLRSATQRESTTLKPGQADDEWLAHLHAEGRSSLAEDLAPLLETCERIRFGGLQPTRFAIAELLQASESVLERQAPDAPKPTGAAA